jgi:hypothetical protein
MANAGHARHAFRHHISTCTHRSPHDHGAVHSTSRLRYHQLEGLVALQCLPYLQAQSTPLNTPDHYLSHSTMLGTVRSPSACHLEHDENF